MSGRQITVLWGGKKQAAYLLDEGHVVIGRGRSAHIPLDDNPIVSRRHAVIRAELDGSHTVEDLGGANGTWIHDRRIQKHILQPGDVIILGKHSLRYEAATRMATSLKQDRRNAPADEPVATQTSMSALPDVAAAATGAPAPPPAPGAGWGSAQLGPKPGAGDSSAPWEGAAPAPASLPRSPSVPPSLLGGGMAGQERTMAASREELEHLLEQARLKSAPHLSFRSKAKGVQYVPLPERGFLIGHTDDCGIRLDGNKLFPFGRIAAELNAQQTRDGLRWWVIAKSPMLNPVTVNGKKVQRRRELKRGSVIGVRRRKLRFSPGEDD